MRRKIGYRVCSCMPNGVVTHLETRLLREIVNREIHPIRCAASCKRKYLKGMRIGDLCAETGHFRWALKVWEFTECQISNKDWDDWRYEWFNDKWVSIRDVLSESECEFLSQRRSGLWAALFGPEEGWWDVRREHYAAMSFGTYYSDLWAEKYDYYPEYMMEEYERGMREEKARQDREQLFREAQGENMPACSQDFTEYWHGGPHVEDFSWLDDRNARW